MALRVAWVALLGFVAACSLVPSNSAAKRMMDSHFNDKLGHAAAYFSLALLPALHESRRVSALQAAAALLVGVALEAAQALYMNRAFDAGDIAANVAGVWIALLAARRLRPRVTPWLLGRREGAACGPQGESLRAVSGR